MFASALISDCDIELFELSLHEWKKYGINAKRVDNIVQAIHELSLRPYQLIVIVETKALRQDILAKIYLIKNMTSAPIVIASYDKIDPEYRITAHKHGVVDVWEVPATIQEAVAKGHAFIRQYITPFEQTAAPHVIIEADITMIIDYRLVLVNGTQVDLHRIEFNILKLLISNPGRVFTYEQIIKEAWGEEYIDNSKNSLWVQMKRLKEKLQVTKTTPNFIKNTRGIGYSFQPSPNNS